MPLWTSTVPLLLNATGVMKLVVPPVLLNSPALLKALVPLLKDPAAAWDYPAITTYDFSEYSIRTERWRYIRYIDGSEELYDQANDPEEWTNLAADPAFREIKDEMAGYIPADPAPLAETSYAISPHHVPPFRSLEHYLEWKSRQASGR